MKLHWNYEIPPPRYNPGYRHFEGETLNDKSCPCHYRSGNEEKLMALLTPLNVNCHASDGRKVKEPLVPHRTAPDRELPQHCPYNMLCASLQKIIIVFHFKNSKEVPEPDNLRVV